MANGLDKVTHDMRGKISAILLAATLIRDGKAGALTPEMHEFSGIILKEAESLSSDLRSLADQIRQVVVDRWSQRS